MAWLFLKYFHDLFYVLSKWFRKMFRYKTLKGSLSIQFYAVLFSQNKMLLEKKCSLDS